MKNTRPFIQDQYSDTRGGQSVWLNLFCAQCGEFAAQYQKDFGAPEHNGPLYRGYLDRFVKPKTLVEEYSSITDVQQLKPLMCTGCSATLAKPIIYEKEERLAVEFERAAIIKRTLNGEQFEPTDIH